MENFRGILTNKEDVINKSNFQFYIDNNIFIETIFNKNLDDNDYSGIELGGDYKFWNYFQFNKKEYTLNPKVYIEYFNCIYTYLNIDFPFESYSDIIEIELETSFGNDKIVFLTKMLKNELRRIRHIEEYRVYKKSKAENNHVEWYRYLYENYYEDQLLITNIFEFLSEPDFDFEHSNRLFYDVIVPFKFIYKVQSDIELLKNQHLIKNSSDTENNKIELHNHIFKNKNYPKFIFVNEEYSGKKNTAFYSQLFKYFQEKDWLNIKGDDSKEYRDFIVGKCFLEQFSKIQQKTSIKTDTKWDKMFNTFNDILINYSAKNE